MIRTQAKSYRIWVGIAITVHFSVIMLLGLSRHWGFMTSINDLGVFDQAIWGALHGHSLLNTSQFNQPINWLGFHFHPILFLFVPLYALIPNVIWFTTAQSFALSMSAWPIFLLSSRVCQSEKTGLLWSLAYLMNPFLINAATWDFHPITLAVPFVAIGMLSIELESFLTLLLSCVVILLCKEQLGVMVIGFGILWWIYNKEWKTGASLILLGIACFVLVLKFIMPAFSPTGEHLMFDSGLGQLSRYSWLGSSLKEVFQGLLFHPIYIVKTAMFEMGGARYLLLLLIFFLGFPLAAPEYLFPGLADLVANLLSANSMPRSPFAYHSVSLVPVLTAAGIYGAKRLSALTNKLSLTEFSSFVFVASFIGGYYFAPLSMPGMCNIWAPVHILNLPDPQLNQIRSIVSDEASISVQANVGAHFSQRKEIYCFPNNIEKVDAVVLRLESPTNNINSLPDQLNNIRKYRFNMLDGHLQMDRIEYLNAVERLLFNKEYGAVYWNDPWLVFKRGFVIHGINKEVEYKINQLRKEWQIT